MPSNTTSTIRESTKWHRCASSASRPSSRCSRMNATSAHMWSTTLAPPTISIWWRSGWTTMSQPTRTSLSRWNWSDRPRRRSCTCSSWSKSLSKRWPLTWSSSCWMHSKMIEVIPAKQFGNRQWLWKVNCQNFAVDHVVINLCISVVEKMVLMCTRHSSDSTVPQYAQYLVLWVAFHICNCFSLIDTEGWLF